MNTGTQFVTAANTLIHSTVATPTEGAMVVAVGDIITATGVIEGVDGRRYIVTSETGEAVSLVEDGGSAVQAVFLAPAPPVPAVEPPVVEPLVETVADEPVEDAEPEAEEPEEEEAGPPVHAASKAEWVEYVVANFELTQEAAEAMTKAELIAQYGD